MIDKYRLENMRRESGEKGELGTCRLKVTCIMPSRCETSGYVCLSHLEAANHHPR